MEEIEALRYIVQFKEDKLDYMVALGSTSKRIIPKKLIYMGNFNIFEAPGNEKRVDFKDLYIYSEWKYWDEYIYKKIESYF